jgi:hypothetical protein
MQLFRRRRDPAPVRTVDITPPSSEDELVWVCNAAAFVVLVVFYVIAFETHGFGNVAATAATDGLLPYQVLFRDLPAAEQRTFRAMQEGAGEATRMRSDGRIWPAVASLADAGIPPFARDPLDRAGLQWSERAEGLLVNYLGIPSGPTPSPAFLILVQEPDPVTGEKPPPPSVVDEEHQLLTDGTLLHVTYWKQTTPALRPGIIGDPASAGWTQLRVTSPSQELRQWRDRLGG